MEYRVQVYQGAEYVKGHKLSKAEARALVHALVSEGIYQVRVSRNTPADRDFYVTGPTALHSREYLGNN